MRRLFTSLFLCPLVLCACSSSKATSDASPDANDTDAGDPNFTPKVELGRHDVTVVDSRRVVPGPGLPMETPAQNSNNNLDVIRHQGRVYLAWRTAPDHFASPMTRMHVVSSTDETNWTWETSLQMGSDMREPRFLSLGDKLFLYIARLGTDPIKFEPQGVSYVVKDASGWSQPKDLMKPGAVAWRTKNERGTNYMLSYTGGEHIYDFSGLPLAIEMATSTDGVAWTGQTISTGGGSETDFAIGDDGTLFGIIRNEEGDAQFLFGSKVCKAMPGSLMQWNCKVDPKKYDSPLMFWYDGEAYLIGRRNVTETGNYDLMQRDLSLLAQNGAYQIDYKNKPKRCSLWRYVQAEQRIAFVLDLPSKGDTCFPARIDGAQPGEMIVYNYTSDPNGPDVSWGVGQGGPTYIDRHVLRFTKR